MRRLKDFVYAKLQNEGGFALTAILVVFGVMTVIMTLAVVLLPLTQSETTETSRETATTQSLYVAEAGLNDYVWHLNRIGAEYYYNTTHPAQGDDTSTGEPKWVSYGDNGGSYHLDITENTENAGFNITATGFVVNGDRTTTKTIEAVVGERTFTRYIWFTNFEKVEGSTNRIYFTTGDILRGRLRTNDEISINYDPIFMKYVMTHQTIYYKHGGPPNDNPDFQEGYEEGCDSLDMPSTNATMNVWADPAYNNGTSYQYTGMTKIYLHTLAGKGVMDVENNNGSNTGITGTNLDLPPSGVIYVNGTTEDSKGNINLGDVFLSGELKGRLTIGAKNNIYLTGDVKYNDQTFSDPNSDMLGLVAENYIYILHFWSKSGSPPNGSAPFDPTYAYTQGWFDYYDITNVNDVAPHDITINAAMMTVNHSFGYERYDVMYDWPFKNQDLEKKGYITVKGSIVQNYRGVIGFIGTSGYLKDYDYDPRMMYRQPPHFITPINSGFEIVSWKEVN